MSTQFKVKENSKYQYSFKWWIEQLIMLIIATIACLFASINF